MLKKILTGAGGDAVKYLPVRLVPALTSLITVPVFTRMVEPSDYGNFYLVGSLTSFVTILATGWLTSTVVRFYWSYKREDKSDNFIATILWSTITSLALVTLLTAAILAIFPSALDADVRRLLPIAYLGLIVNCLITVMQQVMRAANRAGAFAALAVVSNVLATIFAVFFVAQMGLGSYGILLGVALGNLLLVPLGLVRTRSEGSLSPTRVSKEAFLDFANFGFPLLPAALSGWALVLSDRYVIGLTRTAAEVGIYAVAYGLGDKIMSLIVAPLLMTMGPVMVMTFENEGAKLARQVQTHFTRYFLLATMPLLAGMTALSMAFMTVFTGDKYQAAYAILPVVAASVMLNGLSQIAGQGVSLYKKTPITMTNALIGAGFQITANLLLVPRYGYMVAPWTTLSSYLLLLALTWLRSRPFMRWEIPWSHVGRIVLAAAGMGVIVRMTSLGIEPSFGSLILQALLGVVVYVFLLLLLREIRPDERQFVMDGVRRIGERLRKR